MIDMNVKTAMSIGLVLVVLLIAWTIERRHRNLESKLDLDDLLLGDDGRMSRSAVVLLCSFVMTTWMMIYLTLQGQMTEGYLGIYIAAWITPTVTKMIVERPQPQTNVTNVTNTEQVVNK